MGVRGLSSLLTGRGRRWELKEDTTRAKSRLREDSQEMLPGDGATGRPAIEGGAEGDREEERPTRSVVIDASALAHWLAAKRPPPNFSGQSYYHQQYLEQQELDQHRRQQQQQPRKQPRQMKARTPATVDSNDSQQHSDMGNDDNSDDRWRLRCTCPLLFRQQSSTKATDPREQTCNEAWPVWALGHDFDFVALQVQALVAAFCVVGGWELYCVFDGGTPPYKQPTRRLRLADRILESQETWLAACVLREACQQRCGSSSRMGKRTSGGCSPVGFGNMRAHSVSPMFVMALRNYLAACGNARVHVIQALEEADSIVSAVANRCDSPPSNVVVLSDDSDFMSIDLGPAGEYVPMSSLVFGSCPEHGTPSLGSSAVVAVGEGFSGETISKCLFGTMDDEFHSYLSPVLSAAAGNDWTLPREDGAALAKLRNLILAEVRNGGNPLGKRLRSGRELTELLARGLMAMIDKFRREIAKTVAGPNSDNAILAYVRGAMSALGLSYCACSQKGCVNCEITSMLRFSYSFCLFGKATIQDATDSAEVAPDFWLSSCGSELLTTISRSSGSALSNNGLASDRPSVRECIMPCVVERSRSRHGKRHRTSLYSVCLPLWKRLSFLLCDHVGTVTSCIHDVALVCSNFNHVRTFTLGSIPELPNNNACALSSVCQLDHEKIHEFGTTEQFSLMILRILALASTEQKQLTTAAEFDATTMALASAARPRCASCFSFATRSSVCNNKFVSDALSVASAVSMIGASLIDLSVQCCERADGQHTLLSPRRLLGSQTNSWRWKGQDLLRAFEHVNSSSSSTFADLTQQFFTSQRKCASCVESGTKFAVQLRATAVDRLSSTEFRIAEEAAGETRLHDCRIEARPVAGRDLQNLFSALALDE